MLDKSTIAIAILAAGRGSRFASEQPKPLVLLRGRPLLSYALDAAKQSQIGPTMVVLGYKHDEISSVVENSSIIYNPNYLTGLSSSLHSVIEFLEPQNSIQAVCIGLADQPLIGPDAYRSLASSYQKGSIFSVATYQGIRANPVLLARPLWPEIAKLKGDVGAKALMSNHPIVEVDCSATGNPQDIDTKEDLLMMNKFSQETQLKALLDRAKKPRYRGKTETIDRSSCLHSPYCGDIIELSIQLNPSEEIIEDIRFEGESCLISTASADLMAETLIGKTTEQALSIAESFLQMMKGGKSFSQENKNFRKLNSMQAITNPLRIKCTKLAWYTLKQALENNTC